MDKEVVIVIPVYRQMTACERASLLQCIRVLGRYPIVLAAGASLPLDAFLALHPFRVERFTDEDFASVCRYSQLLLSDRFYARFAKYRYLLIYQLDAFVFSDRLREFCMSGYDYIGSPLPRWLWKRAKNRVGNGGLSLRRIAACRRVLRCFPPEQFSHHEFCDRPEDYYFAACAVEPGLDFHVPPLREALEFSVEYDIYHCYRQMPEWLPFGCHRWSRDNYGYWYPIISGYGYDLPKPSSTQLLLRRWKNFLTYFEERASRPDAHISSLRNMVNSIFPVNRVIVLWGWGIYGKRAAHFLQIVGRTDVRIYDRKKTTDDFGGRRIGTLEEIPSRIVLVSTLTYENEICEELRARGLRENEDFLRGTAFFEKIARAYLGQLR